MTTYWRVCEHCDGGQGIWSSKGCWKCDGLGEYPEEVDDQDGWEGLIK